MNITLFDNVTNGVTNEYGEVLYRCDGKSHIPRIYKPHPHWWGRLLGLHGKCEHTFELARYITGYSCKDAAYECDICTKCGKIINWKQLY